ncbi:MAG TPA: 1-(5-phosphoribosyl)-5-[(5-phosphoribosylamino)methylideneamino]imidazole-4-carboxamide isomerase [Pyrinomonadaceae bacterium]|jgi:phosphoribosylformimino-5-aminoimidazole carboxamide ribotide isomerase
MLIIPAIDLRRGLCVRLTQGRKEDASTYDGDPVSIAQGYKDDGAQMLHLVDLDSVFGEDGSINRAVVRRLINSVDIPVQFGGGLRSIADVEELIAIGAARVVIGTLAVEAPEELARMVGRFGSRICVGIDARDGQARTRGWESEGRISAIELARRVARAGVERIVYTDVARDGTLGGVNIEQTRNVARESGLKVTASGGVSTLDDIRVLKNLSSCGVDSVIVGKALYEGRFTLGDALREID